MQKTQFPSLADHVRTLPAEGRGRERQLNRLIDLHASAEAAAALQAAASHSDVLASADAVFGGALVDRGLVTDEARDRFRDAVASPEFLALLPDWVRELRKAALLQPESGACTVATALELWSWTMKHLHQNAAVVDELAEAVCPLLAARCLALDVANESSPLRRDLSHAFAARAASRAGAACAELVFGYRRHLTWGAEGCATCYGSEELDGLEGFIPGIAGYAGDDVLEADGSHPAKAGPCVRFDGVDSFLRLRRKLDGCLTGARIARDRAGNAISDVSA
ncbi:MAG: hypothetical protein ACXWH7_00355 [Thermoanaerobaculia bacterium]